MRKFMALILLGLGACDAPLEHYFPPQDLSFLVDGRTIDVRAQYDPVEFGWFLRFSDRTGRMELQDRPIMVELIRHQIGPELCGPEGMGVWPGNIVTGFGAPRERYLPTNGEWQLVAGCA